MTEPAADTNVETRIGQRVTGHYQRLLAAHYTWMLGDDIEATAAAQRGLLAGLLPAPQSTHPRAALDLGCGSGAQALALADLGYSPVTAVDTDPTLLAELRSHTAGRPTVQTHQADAVAAITDLEPKSVAAAVCMGDTLLHLASRPVVGKLIAELARVLQPGGAVLLTYRDLTGQLYGTERFIPVRSDENRIMMCFLDVADPDVVEVHDVIHTRTEQGWTMTASSYPKLRLAPAWIRDQLSATGLEVTHHEPGPTGMWRTQARSPVTSSV